jgi:hypothetical protein
MSGSEKPHEAFAPAAEISPNLYVEEGIAERLGLLR